jgi:NitT/TauT family transport system ATP-binding protein
LKFAILPDSGYAIRNTQYVFAVIEIDHVSFAYPSAPGIFEDFSWQAERGQAWTVLGPSGCGKTTLLYLLAGLQLPTGGQVRVDGQTLTRPRPQTGLILQEYGLLPWATVRENVSLGLQIRGFYGPDGLHAPEEPLPQPLSLWSALQDEKTLHREDAKDAKEDKSKREEKSPRPTLSRLPYGSAKRGARVENDPTAPWLNRLGLSAQADKYPGQLSGGQRQRAAIARTLVLQPDLLLMDEPFSALDAPTRLGLEDLTLQLWKEQSFTFVVVTHAIEEAAYLGQSILVLGHPPHRSGKVFQNPVFGQAGARDSEDYRQLCRELRDELEGGG